VPIIDAGRVEDNPASNAWNVPRFIAP